VHGFCSHQPMKCSRQPALANIFPILNDKWQKWQNLPPLNQFSFHLLGIRISLFPSKVAPCFHVPTVFRFSGHWTRQPARATWIKHLTRQASVQNTTVLLHVWFETFCWLHCQLNELYPPQFPSTASFPIYSGHNYEINSARHYPVLAEPIPFQGGCLQSLERRYLGVHVDVDKVPCSVATSSVHTELPGWGCGLHDFAVQKIRVEGDLCLSVEICWIECYVQALRKSERYQNKAKSKVFLSSPHAYAQPYHLGKYQASMGNCFGLVWPHQRGIIDTCRGGFLQTPLPFHYWKPRFPGQNILKLSAE